MSLIKIFLGVPLLIILLLWNYPICTEEKVKGAQVFQLCNACHFLKKTENKIGPSLKKIINRNAGTYPGYKFSMAMIKAGKNGLIWNKQNLTNFLENPQKVVKGTRMVQIKITSRQNIDALLTYIEEMSK